MRKNANKSNDYADDNDNSNNNTSKKPKNQTKPIKKIQTNKAKPFSLQFQEYLSFSL